MPDGQPGDELVAAFNRWAAAQRVADAATGRARQRWMADQAAATATWAGVLVDLAESAASISLALAGGSPALRISGTLAGVGPDFCVIDQVNGRPALVALRAVLAVWPPPEFPRVAPSGDRRAPLEITFSDAIAALVENRSPVWMRAEEHSFEGDLWALGEDIVTIRTPAPNRRLIYLALLSLSICEIR